MSQLLLQKAPGLGGVGEDIPEALIPLMMRVGLAVPAESECQLWIEQALSLLPRAHLDSLSVAFQVRGSCLSGLLGPGHNHTHLFLYIEGAHAHSAAVDGAWLAYLASFQSIGFFVASTGC